MSDLIKRKTEREKEAKTQKPSPHSNPKTIYIYLSKSNR
jgi:hypothetical protein